MNWKRIAVIALIVTSVIFFVLAVTGIIGVWVVNSKVTQVALDILNSVANLLTTGADGLNKADQAITTARGTVATVQQVVEKLGQRVADAPIVIELLSKLLGEDLADALKSLAQLLGEVANMIQAANATVQAVNAIPFVNVDVPGSELIQNINDKLAAIQTSVNDLLTAVQQGKENLIQGVVTTILEPTKKLASGLVEIQGLVNQFQGRIAQAQAQVAYLQQMIPIWIDIAAVVLTLWLIWVALSQVGLFLLARHYLKTRSASAAAHLATGEGTVPSPGTPGEG